MSRRLLALAVLAVGLAFPSTALADFNGFDRLPPSFPAELVLPPLIEPEVAAPVPDVAVWPWDVLLLPVFTFPPAPPVPAPPFAVPPLAVAGPDVATPVWTTVALWIDAWTFAFRASLLNPTSASAFAGSTSPTASTPSASSLRDTYLTSFRHCRINDCPPDQRPTSHVA